MPNITIRSSEGMTPEELQAGLESGRFRHVGHDERIDLTKGDKFVAVPKDWAKLDLLDEGTTGVVGGAGTVTGSPHGRG